MSITPLSYGQERMWVLSELLPRRGALNLVTAVRLTGRLNVPALRQCLDDVARRHDALRMVVTHHEGRPAQISGGRSSIPLRIIDMPGMPAGRAEALAARLAGEETAHSFDLTTGPLVRATVLRLAPDDHLVALAMHHIITDDWSVGLLARELSALYSACLEGVPLPLADTPARSYREFALWQRDDRNEAETHAYWEPRLRNLPDSALPVGRNPASPSRNAETWTSALPPRLTVRLRQRLGDEGGTLFMLVTAALMTLIHRLDGRDDVVVGTLAAGRTRPEFESVLGYFVNVLILRARFDDPPTFGELWRRVRQECLGAVAHQDMPYERLLELLRRNGELGAASPVRVLCVAQQPPPPLKLAGLEARPAGVPHRSAQFDLVLELREHGDNVRLAFTYDTDVLDEATVQQLGRHLRALLDGIATSPDTPCDDLPLEPPRARKPKVIEGHWEPGLDCIHDLFERRAARSPDAVTLVHHGTTVTYRCLNQRANRLARRLIAAGVGPEDRVGLCLHRSAEAVIAALAVLKTGAAYVPLDPAHPPQRLAWLIEDAATRLVVTTSPLRNRCSAAGRVLLIEDECLAQGPAEDLKLPVSHDNAAYVIYTSGSTGLPKGVVGTHRGMVNRFRWMWHAEPFEPGERVCHRTALAFVDSVWEMFGPMSGGVPIEIVDDEAVADPARLVDSLERAAVTRVTLVPSLLHMILDSVPDLEARLPALRQCIVSGERLPEELAERFHNVLSGRTLLNLYGSTEAAADVTAARIGPGERVSIGRAIDGVEVGVVGDPPPLIAGELEVAGAALARGYLGRPGETAARFLPFPYGPPGARAFRTGDLARVRAGDEALEFLGRLDDQVAIRGHRVELGEIEQVLRRHPLVAGAAVRAWPDGAGSVVLAAYVILSSTAGKAAITEIRSLLRGFLPPQAIPAVVAAVEELPLTVSGKLDRGRLPHPRDLGEALTIGEGPPLAPRTVAEKTIGEIFTELLPLPWHSVHDDFFALGGHSLLAVTAVKRVSDRLGVTVGLRDLLAAPTIAGLGERVTLSGGEARSAPPSSKAVARPDEWFEPFPLTDVQQAYWIGRDADLELGNVATHAYFEVEVEGPLDVSRLSAAITYLVERHHSLRTVLLPDGRQQVLSDPPEYQVAVADLRRLAPEDRAVRLRDIRDGMSHQVLAVDRWPLFDIRVSRLRDDLARIHVSIDALIADAYSVRLLMSELALRYREPETDLEPLSLTFRDCVLHEASNDRSAERERALAYWRERLPDLPEGPMLPLAQEPGAVAAPRFVRHSASLAGERWERLAAAAADHGLTATTVALAAFTEVLSHFSAHPHYTLMLTLFNRFIDHPQANQLVGDFTSLIPLEVDHRDAEAFLPRARRLQARLWEDLDHRQLSGVAVMREWEALRGTAPRLIAPVVFTSALGTPPQEAETEPLGKMGYGITQTPQLFLDHQVAETSDGLLLTWDAVDDLFPPALIDTMFDAYTRLLNRLIDDPGQWAATVDLPAGTDGGSVGDPALREAEATGTWQDSTLHGLVAAAAGEHADRTAVVAGETELTYADVMRRASVLARRLLGDGAGPDRLVGIAMHKGWEPVVAALAVLSTGAAYVPLDPDLPAERMRRLAEQTELAQVLTQPWLHGRLPGLEKVDQIVVDGDAVADEGDDPVMPRVHHDPAGLAYVIFTSGSTGFPKGVMIDHRGAVNTIVDINQRFEVGPQDRVLALSSLSFDLSVYDIFGALAAGATIVVPEHGRRREPAHWIELVRTRRVSIWNSVPALMGLAADYCETLSPDGLASLRLVLLSGDWIPQRLPGRIRRLAAPVDVIGLGGATEASIWSVFHRIEEDEPVGESEPVWTSVPYGRPLARQGAYVLDHRLRQRPDWVAGDLYLAGAGLALGYWRDPRRSAESFIHHPRTGERLYRTGDRARRRPGGLLEFLGREDDQVKISGYRVELGEVETALQRVPGVVACAVVAAGPARGDRRLVGYVVAEPGVGLDSGRLRRSLGEQLPGYLVPGTFVQVQELPLTPNGKVDRAALASGPPAAPEAARTAPSSALHRQLTRLWAEVLDVDQVGLDDNFFRLGGTSLVAVRLLARLEAALGTKISLVRLYDSPTVRELAWAIGEGTRPAGPTSPELTPDPAGRFDPFPLTDIQQAYWMGRRRALALGNVATHSYQELDVADLDVDRLQRSVRRLVERHDMLRTVIRPDGRQQVLSEVPPYRIRYRDLRDDDHSAEVLDETRSTMSHSVRDPGSWPLFEIRAHRLSDRWTRLHVGVDLLIADALSFEILRRELMVLYSQENAELPSLECSFRDYVLAAAGLRGGEAHRRAECYWRDRLQTMPGAPPLPLVRGPAEIEHPAFHRLEDHLPADAWSDLRRLASEADLTPSGVLCAAFAEVIAAWSQSSRFLLNLTTFNRLPLHPDVGRIVGDFTSTALLSVDATAPTFTQRARRLQKQIFSDLEHHLVSGVEVARMLRADPRRRTDTIAPIVFTSTLLPDPPAPPADTGLVAEPVFSVSQTPQVLLDLQVYEHDGALAYTWDHVAQAFPDGMISAMFDAYRRVLVSLIVDRAYWKAGPAWSL
jgi:amino acid adenylation domain-containing protein